MLLDGLWRRRFGADSSVIGRTIDFGNERVEVIGVMPPGFRVPTYEQAEVLTPLDLDRRARNPNASQVRAHRLFGRVKPGVSVQAAQADVDRAGTPHPHPHRQQVIAGRELLHRGTEPERLREQVADPARLRRDRLAVDAQLHIEHRIRRRRRLPDVERRTDQ